MRLRRSRLKVKRLPDGRSMINAGCGFRTHHLWNNIDYSPYVRLARWMPLACAARRMGVISELQMDRIAGIDPESTVWDLRRGFPFPDDLFDVVYHSHFLEHLPRDEAAAFLLECHRVLRPGGWLRVVVPDLERLVAGYTSALHDAVTGQRDAAGSHEAALHALFDQMVRRDRRESTNTHGGVAGLVQRWFRGDPARNGELHRWMYDRVSLSRMLDQTGFGPMGVYTATTSNIEGWSGFFLDTNPEGTVYKDDSLYMEAQKPNQRCGRCGDSTASVNAPVSKAKAA